MNTDFMIPNYINGKFEYSNSKQILKVKNPATNETLANVPISTNEETNKAIYAAKQAFITWSKKSISERISYLFSFKTLLDKNINTLSNIITKEHGKTISESLASIKRGIENIEHACSIHSLMTGNAIANITSNIDARSEQKPLGVFAAITPYNFPIMVSLWFWPYAIVCGNTFILKPSEQVPMSQQFIFELIHKINLPKGVMNLLHGDKETVTSIINNDDIIGISFVGSTKTAKTIYRTAASKGKRVQALGSAKNFAIIMKDANIEKSVNNITNSAFGCAGQRCLAISHVIAIDDIYKKFINIIINKASNLIVGNGADKNIDIGPLISFKHKQRICYYIEKGEKEGANILLDGRKIKQYKLTNGYYIGPTIFSNVTSKMAIYNEEIFGPVLLISKAKNLDDAICIINKCKFANSSCIYTESGKSAREFKQKIHASMIGINIGIPAPMTVFPFGGTKQSFFGDIKAHGKHSINFFSDTRVIVSRWF